MTCTSSRSTCNKKTWTTGSCSGTPGASSGRTEWSSSSYSPRTGTESALILFPFLPLLPLTACSYSCRCYTAAPGSPSPSGRAWNACAHRMCCSRSPSHWMTGEERSLHSTSGQLTSDSTQTENWIARWMTLSGDYRPAGPSSRLHAGDAGSGGRWERLALSPTSDRTESPAGRSGTGPGGDGHQRDWNDGDWGCRGTGSSEQRTGRTERLMPVTRPCVRMERERSTRPDESECDAGLGCGERRSS